MGTDTNNPLNMLILPPHTATPRGRSIPSDLSYRQWLQHKKNTNRFYKIHNSCSIIPIPILLKSFFKKPRHYLSIFLLKLALLMTTLYFPILSPYPITLLPIAILTLLQVCGSLLSKPDHSRHQQLYYSTAIDVNFPTISSHRH